MKKFMKLLIATALIVTMAVCFAACGGKTMEKVYDLSGVKATAVATKTGQLNDFTDQGSTTDEQGEWVVVYKTNYNDKKEYVSTTYTLYNAATEKVVATSTTKNDNPFMLYNVFGESVAVKLSGYVQQGNSSYGKYTKVSAVYYAETTVDLGSVDIDDVVVDADNYDYDLKGLNDNAQLVKVGDYIFKVVDGVMSHVENATASVSGIDEYMNGYYYTLEQSGVTVYDANLNLYGFVRVPSYASAYPIVLANGNVLIQYTINQDPYGDDYDMISVNNNYGSATKSNITTLLYNVEKNTAKEIKFDYLVEGVETENLAEKVDNIAYMYEIKDNRVDYNEEAAIVAKLSNNGKVGTIYGKAEDYLVNAYMRPVAENRFMGISISGEKVLYNEEMEKIATFTSSAYANEQYIVDGSKYYTFDGVLIADTAKYFVRANFANGNAIYADIDYDNNTTDYYLIANNTMSKIATTYTGVDATKTSGETFATFGDNYYVITKWTKNSDTGLKSSVDYVYNMNGAKLTETVSYVDRYANNSENKATAIYNRKVVTEAEGLLVFRVTVEKYNENKKDDKGNVVPGYETFTEYYYCK